MNTDSAQTGAYLGYKRVCIHCNREAPLSGCPDCCETATRLVRAVIRPTTVKPAGPFGGNSQSGRTAQHGTQSGYVMHRRHRAGCDALASLKGTAGQRRDCACDREACQPCKDAHAAYVRGEDPVATKFYGYPVQRDGRRRKP